MCKAFLRIFFVAELANISLGMFVQHPLCPLYTQSGVRGTIWYSQNRFRSCRAHTYYSSNGFVSFLLLWITQYPGAQRVLLYSAIPQGNSKPVQNPPPVPSRAMSIVCVSGIIRILRPVAVSYYFQLRTVGCGISPPEIQMHTCPKYCNNSNLNYVSLIQCESLVHL